jgi:hypothetical protein
MAAHLDPSSHLELTGIKLLILNFVLRRLNANIVSGSCVNYCLNRRCPTAKTLVADNSNPNCSSPERGLVA